MKHEGGGKQDCHVLFGGSFNPPHLGHLALANAAAATFQVSSVSFIPNYLNPLKESHNPINASHRLALLKILLEETEHQIITWEIEREGPSWTIETIHFLQAQDQRSLVFLIGADCLKELHLWREVGQLFERLEFCVIAREGFDVCLPPELCQLIGHEKSEALRRTAIKMPSVPISSTTARQKLQRGQIPDHMPPAVMAYIQKQGLYGWPQS